MNSDQKEEWKAQSISIVANKGCNLNCECEDCVVIGFGRVTVCSDIVATAVATAFLCSSYNSDKCVSIWD